MAGNETWWIHISSATRFPRMFLPGSCTPGPPSLWMPDHVWHDESGLARLQRIVKRARLPKWRYILPKWAENLCIFLSILPIWVATDEQK